jgi:hypothetical protein
VGYSFAIIAALSFIFGLLVGRLSAGSEIRYVIPKELGPQVRLSPSVRLFSVAAVL